MEKYNYILGLDLGVGSVGWGCLLVDKELQPLRVLDMNSRIFDSEGASMEDRRIARGTRRVLRRRKSRATRTRNLFVKYQYLPKEEAWNTNKQAKLGDPYTLRLKGKEGKLTMEELEFVLVHYAKGRGFKSNRKSQEEDLSKVKDNDEQKMLAAKQKTENYLAEKQKENSTYTLTNMLVEQASTIGKIRNSSQDYQNGITRKMVKEEVTLILDTQIKEGIISEEFKNDYLDILLYQRLFSDGPDEPSPYHNPLEKMVGNCTFIPGEKRAAKASCSYELFTLVQKLADLRFYEVSYKENQKLSVQQIEELVNLAQNDKAITYKLVKKVIGKEVNFVGLTLSKQDYFKIVEDCKNNLEKNLKEERADKLDKIVIGELSNTKKIKSMLKKITGKTWELSDQQYDLIADCITKNKSDFEIDNYLKGQRNVLMDVELPLEIKEVVKNLEDSKFKEFGKLSFKFLYQALPLMIHEGLDYYHAAEKLGYYKEKVDFAGYHEIPVIDKILNELNESITNKAVIRTLVETRKVVNAVINKYGKPVRIHVEMARELTKGPKERKELQDQMVSNQIANSSLREQIYSKFSDRFKSPYSITNEDLLQYKLYIEQQGICPYSILVTGNEQLSKIKENDLFTNEVEIDHIIPYSISYDDRPINKTLVYKKYNQEKGNRVPLDAFSNAIGFEKYKAFVNQYRINPDKSDRYLASKVDERFLNDYRARTINDTRYAATAMKRVLTYTFPDVKVYSFTGQITAKLRGVWRLNGLTHSYEAKDYKKKHTENKEIDSLERQLGEKLTNGVGRKSKEYREIEAKIRKLQNDEEVKNRENHLHHALDAIVIASATNKIRRRIEMHEMMLRQNKDKLIHFKIPNVNEETGEVLSFEEFDMTLEDYLLKYKDEDIFGERLFPQPYYKFREELILRTYELNQEELQYQLSMLSNYQGVDVTQIVPSFVSHHFSSKLSGRLHKATKYGKTETENGDFLTQRISVNSTGFTAKSLEKLVDKDHTQKYVLNTLQDWLGDFNNGAEAYAKKGYPVNTNGNTIKKIKILESESKEAFSIKEGTNQFVKKEDVVQVHIYRRANDEKLYFVGMDRYRLLNSDKREDIPFVLWSGLDYNRILVQKNQLKENGFIKEPLKLFKGQTVLIEKNNGSRGMCLIVGFTGGKLEVRSILGDGADLAYSGLFNDNKITRYILTVSTIKSIKPISIDVLGKIHSNVL